MDNSEQIFGNDPESSNQSLFSSNSNFNEFAMNRFNPKKKTQSLFSMSLPDRLKKI